MLSRFGTLFCHDETCSYISTNPNYREKSTFLLKTLNFQFFNKNVPDEETSLTEFDYQMMDVYKDNDPITVNDINNTAMYSPNRFEGDIGKP